MSFISSYGCSSAAGNGIPALWDAVRGGRDCSGAVSTDHWPVTPLTFQPRACLWPDHDTSMASRQIMSHLHRAWREARDPLARPVQNFGVIFASTKGSVEDAIWEGTEGSASEDFIGPLFRRFLEEAELRPRASTVVSNACSSSLSALWLGEMWLEREVVDTVLILAADFVGPFVLQGFHALQALSPTTVRPFAATRDGLQLGEAAACLVLERSEPSDLRLESAAIDAEGFAVTRPSPSGTSLERAIASLKMATEPELIIGHGTGTFLNDQTEDRVFQKLFPRVPVTASKWCVGHTLGASGLIDTILACESIRRGATFSIASTETVDPSFGARYLTPGSDAGIQAKRVLVTSLGFGGIHAAVSIRRWT